MRLVEQTAPGMHDFLVTCVLCRNGRAAPATAVDLGSGSGAFAVRLVQLGFDLTCCDIDDRPFKANLPFVVVDLDDPDFPERLGTRTFDLVAALEVIEHLENPVAFLRNVRRLLKPDGSAIVTTPHLESLHSRVKFLVKGKLRGFDEFGNVEHLSPIFWDLLVRQYLPRSGLTVAESYLYPPDGYRMGNPRYVALSRLIDPFLKRRRLVGDSRVLLMKRDERQSDEVLGREAE